MHSQLAELSLVLASGALYSLPSLVALRDRTITADHIDAMIVNAFAGWTIVGWFFALFLALHKDHPRQPPINLITTFGSERNS